MVRCRCCLVITGGEGERRSELDNHVGRRRISVDSQESPNLKGKGRCNGESADFTKVSVLSLFSANTALRIELQDLALAIAFRRTREIRDAADCQCPHNPPEIPVSHTPDLSLYPWRRRRPKRNRIQRGSVVRDSASDGSSTNIAVAVAASVRPFEFVLPSSLLHVTPPARGKPTGEPSGT